MLSDITRKDRGLLLGLSVVTLLAVALLASGLSSVEVQSSRQLSIDAGGRVADLANLTLNDSALSALSFLAGLFRLLLLVLLPFSIYNLVTSASARKRVLIQLAYLVGFAYLILTLSKTFGQSSSESSPISPSVDPTAVAPEVVAGVAEVPSWVFAIASVAFAILLVTIAVQIYRKILKPKDDLHSAEAEARWALDALDRGVELESVIFRTYYKLCSSSSDRLGIRRARDMTPTEYERVLSKSGLPKSPLATLTRIFEKARYGTAALEANDEHEAVAALNQILGEQG